MIFFSYEFNPSKGKQPLQGMEYKKQKIKKRSKQARIQNEAIKVTISSSLLPLSSSS